MRLVGLKAPDISTAGFLACMASVEAVDARLRQAPVGAAIVAFRAVRPRKPPREKRWRAHGLINALRPTEATKVYAYNIAPAINFAKLRNPGAEFEATQIGVTTWIVERVV